MTGKPRNPNDPLAADQLQPQQMAEEDGLDEAESFANIEPDGATSSANINPND